jgi:maleylpyruvate isomerase
VPKGADGITIGRTVVVRRSVADSPTFDTLLRHELVHVAQFQQLGLTRFVTRYLTEYVSGRRHGLGHHDAYLAISLEHQARHQAARHAPEVKATDVHQAHRSLETRAPSLADAAQRPSHLPGWSIGHVTAHLILNAEALTRVLVATADHNADSAFMYTSPEARSAAIDELASESDSFVERLSQAHRRFEAKYQSVAERINGETQAHQPDVPGQSKLVGRGFPNANPFPLTDILIRRLREVEVHSVDAGLRTYTYHHWPDAYVDAELPLQIRALDARIQTPIHVIDEHGNHHTARPPHGADLAETTPATHLSRRTLLAWILTRTTVPQLPTLQPW